MDQPNLNMRQERWLDVVKDYYCKISYHPSKANVVARTPSHKVVSTPIQNVCLRMTVVSPFLEMMRVA